MANPADLMPQQGNQSSTIPSQAETVIQLVQWTPSDPAYGGAQGASSEFGIVVDHDESESGDPLPVKGQGDMGDTEVGIVGISGTFYLSFIANTDPAAAQRNGVSRLNVEIGDLGTFVIKGRKLIGPATYQTTVKSVVILGRQKKHSDRGTAMYTVACRHRSANGQMFDHA